MTKSYSWLSSIIILVAAIALIMSLYYAKASPSKRKSPPVEPVAVDIAPATLISHRATVSTNVAVLTHRELALVAEVGGKIVEVSEKFVEGGQFAKGDLLVKLEDRDYQQPLAQAKARLASAQQSLASEQGLARQARREWRELGDAQANALFLRKPQLNAAKAQVKAAQADIMLAELNVQRTRITAPFNGSISQRHANLGRYLTPASPIADFYDTERFEVKLPVTDSQLEKLGLSPLTIFSEHSPKVLLEAIVAGKAQKWQARLSHTEGAVDSATQLYQLVAVVDAPLTGKAPLPLGLFVKASLQGNRLDNVVKLPLKAIVKNQQIFLVNDDNKIEVLGVTIIDQDKDNVWVQGNINTNDKIIISDPSQLSVGQTVSSSL